MELLHKRGVTWEFESNQAGRMRSPQDFLEKPPDSLAILLLRTKWDLCNADTSQNSMGGAGVQTCERLRNR